MPGPSTLGPNIDWCNTLPVFHRFVSSLGCDASVTLEKPIMEPSLARPSWSW